MTAWPLAPGRAGLCWQPVCDVLTALGPATAAGETLWAKSSDRPPSEAQLLEWLPPRHDSGPVAATHTTVDPWPGETLGVLGTRPAWGWGLEQGVNTAGVAVGNLAVYSRLDPRCFPPALTGMDLVRLALERGATATEAVDVMTGALERHGQGGSGHHQAERPYWSSFVVADPDSAWVVDTSGPTWASAPVNRTWASSNRPAIVSFDAVHRHPRQPVEQVVEPRLRASRSVLAAEPVTEAALAAHLRSHTGVGGYSVCMHVPGAECTTASMIATLPAGGPPRARCLLGSPCASVYVPLGVGPVGMVPPPVSASRASVLRWAGPSDPVLPADRGPLDAVEAELEHLVRADPWVLADPAWPSEAWARVEAALRDAVPQAST